MSSQTAVQAARSGLLRRRWRLVLAAGFLGLLLWTARDAVTRTFWRSPAARTLLVEALQRREGVKIDLQAMDVVELEERRLQISGLSVEGPAVRVTVDHATCALPSIWPLLRGQLQLGRVAIRGLTVTVDQRPPPRPRRRLPLRISASALELRDGGSQISVGDGSSTVQVSGVEANLEALEFVGGMGLVAGSGSLRLDALRVGHARADAAEFSAVDFSPARIRLGDGVMQLAGGPAMGLLDVDLSTRRHPRLRLEVQLRDGDVAALVEQVTGTPSPLEGRLSGVLVLDTAGLDGAEAVTARAEVELTEGALLLGDQVSPVLRGVLRVAPFLTVRRGRVWLGPTRAVLHKSTDSVEVVELVHTSPRRPLAARGRIQDASLELVVRLLPRSDAGRHAGLGIVVSGTAGALDVRRASPGELIGLGEVP